MKTDELTGAALDWAVAKAKGITVFTREQGKHDEAPLGVSPSNWAQGGRIIEREKIEVFIRDEKWFAYSSLSKPEDFYGETPLIAAMRCYVASKLGDEVEIPEEFV
jgi:hypothetical protein